MDNLSTSLQKTNNSIPQWEINTHYEEWRELKYQHERYQDFWEWYENEYGETKNELFTKFEKWEDIQNLKEA